MLKQSNHVSVLEAFKYIGLMSNEERALVRKHTNRCLYCKERLEAAEVVLHGHPGMTMEERTDVFSKLAVGMTKAERTELDALIDEIEKRDREAREKLIALIREEDKKHK